MTESLKTVRECLDIQRATREPDIEIALQDFLELEHSEQLEFLIVSIMEMYKQIAWLQTDVVKMIEDRK
jgi:hypothetical protein